MPTFICFQLMNRNLLLYLIFALTPSCTTVHRRNYALFESQTSRSADLRNAGSLREFHGETIVFPNQHRVVSQSAPTYFLEKPRRARGVPQIAPPYRDSQNTLSIDEMKQQYGEPDYVDGSGRWHYWGSDEGKLLRVNR